MTVTAGQVQDIQTTIESELTSGTWSLYGATPEIKKDVEKLSSKNTWIGMRNTAGKIVYAFNNAPIYFDDRCELVIHSPNRTDLNKIYADVINIFSASSKNITIESTRDESKKNHYVKRITIKLLDV